MKTITSASLEISLELELWSLFFPSGFSTVEKVRGEGGSVKPQLPEHQGSDGPLRSGCELASNYLQDSLVTGEAAERI